MPHRRPQGVLGPRVAALLGQDNNIATLGGLGPRVAALLGQDSNIATLGGLGSTRVAALLGQDSNIVTLATLDADQWVPHRRPQGRVARVS